MSVLYLESSAVLTWLLGEPKASLVRDAVDKAEIVVTSALTYAEAARAVLRAASDGLLRGGDAQRVMGLLQKSKTGWMTMAVSEDVLARTSRAFPVEPVRTLDAIHLATALEFTRAYSDLRLLSFDRRIQENAVALGLSGSE